MEIKGFLSKEMAELECLNTPNSKVVQGEPIMTYLGEMERWDLIIKNL